jgi:hypothetical protein
MNPLHLGSPFDLPMGIAIFLAGFIVPVVVVRREKIARRRAARLAGRRPR